MILKYPSVASAIEQSRVLLRREAELRDLRDRYATLSRREHDVMALVVSGLLNKQIGAQLRRLAGIDIAARHHQTVRNACGYRAWTRGILRARNKARRPPAGSGVRASP